MLYNQVLHSKSSVIHIVEKTKPNITTLTSDALFSIINGNWLLNSKWIQLVANMDEIANVDLELFEVNGAPTYGILRKMRQNMEYQNPSIQLFLLFYFVSKCNLSFW